MTASAAAPSPPSKPLYPRASFETLSEWVGDIAEFLDESPDVHAFSFQAARSRTGGAKAVGTGEDAGEVLYGDEAEAALSAQGKGGSAEPDDTRGRLGDAVKAIAEKAAGGDRQAQAELLNHGRKAVHAISRELAAAPPADREQVVKAWEAHARDLSPDHAAELAGHFGTLAGERDPGKLRSAVGGLVNWLGRLTGKAAASVAKAVFSFAASLVGPPLEWAAKSVKPALYYVGSLAAAAVVIGAPVAAVAAGVLSPLAGIALAVPALVAGVFLGKKIRRAGANVVGKNFYPNAYGSGTGRKGSAFEGDPRIQNPVSYSESAARDEVALAGPDGRRAAELLSSAKADGVRLFAATCQRAVNRLLKSPDPFAEPVLFDDKEMADVREGLSRVIACADLLGRARVRRRAELAEKRAAKFAEWAGPYTGKKGGVYWLPVGKADAQKNRHYGATPPEVFAEADDDPFHDFAEPVPSLAPAAAVDYFRRLVPTLGNSTVRYGPRLDRHAFTLAVAADQVLLGRVQEAIARALESGGDATPDVQDILDAAGVSHANPQYAEMVVRTNLLDALNRGAEDELAAPEMREAFPVWEYAGILDDRIGEDHKPKVGKFYPNTASFAEVRGPRVWNCRCSLIPVHRLDARLKSTRVEETW